MLRQPVRMHMGRVLLLAGFAVGVIACDGTGASDTESGMLASGTWGGDGAAVIVTDSVIHVHVGCTFGDLPSGIVLDAAGRFTSAGTYVLRAFPVATGPRLPAQFSGRVIGRRLTLAIAVQDTTDNRLVALGPVTVTRGEEAELGPCPICAAPRAASRR